jgi:uncharacterized membrane protein YadS
MVNQKIILPTIAVTITVLVVWLLLDYFMSGQVFLMESLLKAVIFALVFGITYGVLMSRRMKSKK